MRSVAKHNNQFNITLKKYMQSLYKTGSYRFHSYNYYNNEREILNLIV